MKCLLDTCVLSEGAKDPIDPRFAHWLGETSDVDRFVSVLSLAELQFGIMRLPAGRRRMRYAGWYDTILRPLFDTRILPFDERAALVWSQLRARNPNAKTVDAQLAATALSNNLTIVTRNVRDFLFGGLHVFNPWKE